MQAITTSIGFQMSLLLFAALAGHLLAIGLRQPAVVGEILMGLLIGPSLLGWIDYTDFISGTAQLGTIALFALNKGLIQQPAYVSLILMSLLTMIIAPIVLKKILSRYNT
jgi:Kef-type K+ transport system membrane component KefB